MKCGSSSFSSIVFVKKYKVYNTTLIIYKTEHGHDFRKFLRTSLLLNIINLVTITHIYSYSTQRNPALKIFSKRFHVFIYRVTINTFFDIISHELNRRCTSILRHVLSSMPVLCVEKFWCAYSLLSLGVCVGATTLTIAFVF